MEKEKPVLKISYNREGVALRISHVPAASGSRRKFSPSKPKASRLTNGPVGFATGRLQGEVQAGAGTARTQELKMTKNPWLTLTTKILGISGTPIKDGNCDKAVLAALEAAAKLEGVETDSTAWPKEDSFLHALPGLHPEERTLQVPGQHDLDHRFKIPSRRHDLGRPCLDPHHPPAAHQPNLQVQISGFFYRRLSQHRFWKPDDSWFGVGGETRPDDHGGHSR